MRRSRSACARRSPCRRVNAPGSGQVRHGRPDHRASAATGAQMKNGVDQAVEDINAAGGILGQKITVLRRRRLRSEAGRVGGQQVRRRRREVRHRPLQFGRHHARLRGLPGKRHPPDHAGLDQSDRHRTQACGTSSASAAATISRARSRANTSSSISRARRSPSSTTRRPTAKASPTRRRRRRSTRAA